MLETLMKMYVMYMATDVRSPVPHLFGPPGCGKSTAAEQLAQVVGVNLHIINVARLSPLEVEGVQMPHDSGEDMVLKMLPATFWTSLKEADVLMLDEFLRGFPEVYNALLDILTSRRAGAFHLPKVFIMAASNTTTSYDKALEDRLLHLPVDDPRSDRKAKKKLAQLIVEALGLHPEMVKHHTMESLLDAEVLPMFSVLDNLAQGTSAPSQLKGRSVRNLIGQAKLRHVQSQPLENMLRENNKQAMREGKPQYVFLCEARQNSDLAAYEAKARQLVGNPRLTDIQALNLGLNLQLIEMEQALKEREVTTDDGDDIDIDDLLG